MTTRVAHMRKVQAAAQRPIAEQAGSRPWINEETGRIRKGWKYLPGDQVEHVESGEVIDRLKVAFLSP